MRFSISHEFAAEPAVYWKIFLDDEFNQDLYGRIGVKERTVLTRKDEGDRVSWSARVVPTRELPGFMKRLVGESLAYVEHSVLDRSRNEIDVQIEPALMKERTRIRGTYRLTPLGPGRLRRTFEGQIDVDVPLVGRKVEQQIVDDMKRSYEIAAQVTAEWLKKAQG